MRKEKRKVRTIVLNSVRLILLFAFITAFLNNRKLILLVSGIAFLATYLPEIIKRFFGIEVPAGFEIIVILFIYGLFFFGEVQGIYSEFWWWNYFLKIIAGIALGFVGLSVLYALYKDRKLSGTPMIVATYSFCFALAVGTLWEIFEFSLDQLFSFNLQHGSLGDTMLDLIFIALGAFSVSSIGYRYIIQGRVDFISKLITNFIDKNPKIFGKEENHYEKLKKMISRGEHNELEFKSTLRKNLHTNQLDKKVEHSVLRTINAYLNSNGGTLLVGVSDKGELLGLDNDEFPSRDRLYLYFTTMIRDYIGPEFLPFIKFDLVEAEGKQVLKIECVKSNKPVFLKNNNQEEFYVRNGPATNALSGSSLVDYIRHNFERV